MSLILQHNNSLQLDKMFTRSHDNQLMPGRFKKTKINLMSALRDARLQGVNVTSKMLKIRISKQAFYYIMWRSHSKHYIK